MKWVAAMVVAAAAVTMLVYFFTQSFFWAFTVGGICLALDLTFVPKILPQFFDKNK